MVDWRELRELIKDKMEPQELVELLELSIDDILDAFKDEIYQKIDIVQEDLGIDENLDDE